MKPKILAYSDAVMDLLKYVISDIAKCAISQNMGLLEDEGYLLWTSASAGVSHVEESSVSNRPITRYGGGTQFLKLVFGCVVSRLRSSPLMRTFRPAEVLQMIPRFTHSSVDN